MCECKHVYVTVDDGPGWCETELCDDCLDLESIEQSQLCPTCEQPFCDCARCQNCGSTDCVVQLADGHEVCNDCLQDAAERMSA